MKRRGLIKSMIASCLLANGVRTTSAQQIGDGKPATDGTAPVAISPDDPSSLRAGILAAYRTEQKRIAVPPGTYRVPASSGASHLLFEDLADFEIDLTGSTVLLPLGGDGFRFLRCRNVTLRGGELRRVTVPFTQGRVASVAEDRKSYDVRIAAGYPGLDAPRHPEKPPGYLFDRQTRQWKRGGGDYYSEGFEKVADGLYRVRLVRPAGPEMEVGDPIAFRGGGGREIHVWQCERMRIVGTTIRSGSGFCVHEDGGEGGSYYSYTVTYGPRPDGAIEEPLIACNADSFHSSGARKGPILERCRFEGMPDDGVPIHGSYSLVVRADDAKLTVTDERFRPGDPIRLFNPEGGYADEAVVQSVRPLPDFTTDAKSRFRLFPDLTKKRFTEITLDRPLAAGFDYLAGNPNANGSGYVVRDCVIRNHRARGMLLKADNGLVEGNLVEGSTIDGIVFAPELYWNEACYSRNVVVRNNTIRNVGYAMIGPWVTQAGAITLVGEGKAHGDPGHRSLVIESNTFEDCDGINLLVHSARGVTIRGNRFVRSQRNATRRGSDRFDPTSLIYIGDSDGVVLEGNTVVDRGAAGKALVTVTPTASATGAETGVKVAPQ